MSKCVPPDFAPLQSTSSQPSASQARGSSSVENSSCPGGTESYTATASSLDCRLINRSKRTRSCGVKLATRGRTSSAVIGLAITEFYQHPPVASQQADISSVTECHASNRAGLANMISSSLCVAVQAARAAKGLDGPLLRSATRVKTTARVCLETCYARPLSKWADAAPSGATDPKSRATTERVAVPISQASFWTLRNEIKHPDFRPRHLLETSVCIRGLTERRE